MVDTAQQIRLARKRLRMNQAQFAEVLGASQGSVSKWESGREVPRYETIQKISELVGGFQVRDEDPFRFRLKPRSGRYELVPVQATLRGSISDGHKPLLDGNLQITIPLADGWQEHEFEAWYFQNRYDDDPMKKPNLGVFALLSENDRIDDLHRGDRFLITVGEGDDARSFLTSLEGSEPGNFSLWPISKEGKRKLMPIPLTETGRPNNPSVRVRGILLGVFTYSALSDPDSVEPTEF